MRFYTITLCVAALTEATITFEDPSDDLSPSYFTADNAILADYQDASTNMYEWIAITGPYVYDENEGNITRAALYENANDTSVLVVANSSEVYLSHSSVTKLGYSSDLTQAAFFGKFKASSVIEPIEACSCSVLSFRRECGYQRCKHIHSLCRPY